LHAVAVLGDAEEFPHGRWRSLRLGSAEAEVVEDLADRQSERRASHSSGSIASKFRPRKGFMHER